MNQESRELVVLVTRGADHELSSVAFTIACGGITSGLKVCVFLTSAAVDLVRKRSVDMTHVQPMDPLKSLMEDFLKRGGTIIACPPCVKSRGYAQEDFIEGVVIAGASVIHERFKAGAASLSFGRPPYLPLSRQAPRGGQGNLGRPGVSLRPLQGQASRGAL